MRLRNLFVFSGFFLVFSSVLYSQVGINTTNPRTTLEVGGDMNIDGDLRVNEINQIVDGQEATFLIQNSGDFVKEINASDDGLALAYFQEYRLSNMNGDWIAEFDTNIPADQYMMTIISAYFNQELEMDGTASQNFAIPYASAFIKEGTWQIIADYPSASTIAGSQGERVWVINAFILSKTFSKELPAQTFTLSGDNTARQTGTAQTPIIN